ncbi:hypothetical protein GGI13_004829, partial [Coemansia sp. RSA 455]
MKYWVHWLLVLATLTCALQLTFADVEDVEDGGVCEWDDDTDMVSILPFEDDDACELDDDTDMVSILPFADDEACEWDGDTDMVSILPFEDDDACELDDDTLGNTMLEVGKAVKETSLAQVSESSTW